MDGINFKIYDPLEQLVATGGGGGGTIPPGSITGSQIASGTIISSNIASGTVTGGVGGNIASGTITGGVGGNIASGTIENSNLKPGTANTIKGTNSLANVDDFSIGTGLSLSTGASPILSVSKADNNTFGVVKFDPTGDLKETIAGSGIAKIKQPAGPVQAAEYNAAFDSSGNFIISAPARSGTFSLANNTPLTVSNIKVQVAESGGNKAVQIALVNASGAGTGINANGIGLKASTIVSSANDGIPLSTSFVTLSNPAWTDKEVEEWFVYINDGIDNAFYRISAYLFTPNSAITIERLSTQ